MVTFILIIADISLGAGGVNQLIAHGKSKKRSTYAYFLTEEFTPPIEFSTQPDWAPKRRADHGDDLPFVFGGVYLKEHFQGEVLRCVTW